MDFLILLSIDKMKEDTIMPFCPTKRLLELIGTCCVLQTPKVELISQANPSSRLAHTTGLNNPASEGCQAQPATESD